MKKILVLLAIVSVFVFVQPALANWHKLPGATTDAPVVVRHGGGFNLMFVRGDDDWIYFSLVYYDRDYNEVPGRILWSGWQQIPGVAVSSVVGASFVAAAYGGYYHAFSVIARGTDDGIYQTYIYIRISNAPVRNNNPYVFHLKMIPLR